MAVENVAVTYTGTLAAEIGVVVNTAGQVFVGVNSGLPTEVIKLLELLMHARNQVVQQFAKVNNPAATETAARAAVGI